MQSVVDNHAMKNPISLKEFAEGLGISYVAAFKMVKTKRLPAVRIGYQWVVEADEIKKWRKARHKTRYYIEPVEPKELPPPTA